MASRQKPDTTARVLGALVFLLGVGAIVIVLVLAYELFLHPNLGQATGGAPGGETTFMTLASGFGELLVRILLLFVGSVSGSLIATKGVRMYSAALTGSGAGVERSQPKEDA